jgi:signal transduction histidine kinase
VKHIDLRRARPFAESDSDAREVAEATRQVARRLMLAMTLIAIVALSGAFVFVLRRVSFEVLFGAPFVDHHVSIGARDMLLAGIGGSIAAVVLAGIMTVLLTRRAVRPLGDALRIQRSFVADASHELRTPLTILDARVQVIQRMIHDDRELSDEVAELRGDTRALIGIVNDLLAAANVANETTSVEASALGPIVERVIATLRPLAADAGVKIVSSIGSGLTVAIPVVRAERCILILLDNALQHSPRGSTVNVTGAERRGDSVIRVQDEGAGIRGLPASRIFDRFSHSDESRTTHLDTVRGLGYGIGLSLVRDTAVRFGGDVRVDETVERGAAFELVLPARARKHRR